MAAIVLGLCCLSSIIGGGYVAYDRNKITEKEKLYEGTEGLHLFFECNYSGENMLQVTGERLPKREEDESIISVENGFKSFVLTGGYKLDAYQNTNREGAMITYTGPKNIRCLDKPIKSLRFYKA
jgi:hypothetical protein